MTSRLAAIGMCALFTMAPMAGWVALMTVKPVVAGACAGLLGGGGLVTIRLNVAAEPSMAAGITARSTLRLSSVEVSVVGGGSVRALTRTHRLGAQGTIRHMLIQMRGDPLGP